MKSFKPVNVVPLVAVFLVVFAEVALAASGKVDFGNIEELGAFRYVVYFDILIVMYCLHRIYHSMFTVYYFSLQAFFGELLATGLIALLVIAFIPAYLELNLTGTMGYLYFGGIFVLSIVLIARSGKSKQGENQQSKE